MSHSELIGTVREFSPWRVLPLPGQPRERFRGINELAASIAEVGQVTPGIVTLIDGDPLHDAQLVDGERRLRACQKLDRKFRAEVRSPADAETLFTASFAANFGKEDHDPLEIAHSLHRMRQAGKTIEQMAAIAGRHKSWVCQYLSIADLDPQVQAMLSIPEDAQRGHESAGITMQMAMMLVPLPPAIQCEMAGKISSGMTAAAARRLIMRQRRDAGVPARDMIYPSRRAAVMASVARIATDCRHRLGVWEEMPGRDFSTLINAADIDRRHEAIAALRDLAEVCACMADVIAEHLPRRVGKLKGPQIR